MPNAGHTFEVAAFHGVYGSALMELLLMQSRFRTAIMTLLEISAITSSRTCGSAMPLRRGSWHLCLGYDLELDPFTAGALVSVAEGLTRRPFQCEGGKVDARFEGRRDRAG